MKKRTILSILMAGMISWLILHPEHSICFAAEPAKRPEPQPSRRILNTQIGHSFRRFSVSDCEHELAMWVKGRAYEKLAIADSLLFFMKSKEICRVDENERKPGTEDMSLPAGRVKWALERLLGAKLPFTVTKEPSQDELNKMYEVASCAVEAYRQGIMALTLDQAVSLEKLDNLRRRYLGKITPGFVEHPDRCEQAMDDLFGEWPPIGRQYDDLLRIIAVRGENRAYGICYTFRGGYRGSEFYLTVKDGVIRSVGKESLD